MKLQMMPQCILWYGELIDTVFGKVGPTEPSLTKKTIGVVAGVVPWNFPLMTVWYGSSIIGCSVIKPAEDTPLTLELLK